ncbi:MAG: hypothetical protein M3N05_08750, partial [Pseudomonadota bacterium]|nr:hypothetical protein [Pseudomonadota bacterium]
DWGLARQRVRLEHRHQGVHVVGDLLAWHSSAFLLVKFDVGILLLPLYHLSDQSILDAFIFVILLQ